MKIFSLQNFPLNSYNTYKCFNTSSTPKFVDWIVAIIKARFKVSKDQQDKFTYTGMAIRKDLLGAIYLNQNQ